MYIFLPAAKIKEVKLLSIPKISDHEKIKLACRLHQDFCRLKLSVDIKSTGKKKRQKNPNKH